jgi:hypothetical protein
MAATVRKSTYYRCLARTIAPGSPVLADHPRTVNLREDHVAPVRLSNPDTEPQPPPTR